MQAGGIEKSRSRSLSIDELVTVFTCLRDHSDQFARENYLAVALLVVLGVRKGELIAARWNEFDIEQVLWDLPEERSKTGVAISVPLPLWLLSGCWNSKFVRVTQSLYSRNGAQANVRGICHTTHSTQLFKSSLGKVNYRLNISPFMICAGRAEVLWLLRAFPAMWPTMP